MKLTEMPLAGLHAHPRNYNPHDDAQVETLAQSLSDFDQYKNLVAWTDPDDGRLYLIAGHGLWMAAKARGDETVWVNDRSDLTRKQAHALMIADNHTANTDFDLGALSDLLSEFEEPLDLPGVDAEVLAALDLGEEPPEDPGPQLDKAAELQEKWQVQTGDLWQIADHRLVCGDCRDSEIWQRLLDGEKVNGVFTSPPYAEQRKKQYGGIPVGEYVDWWEAVQANVRANLADDGSFFVNIKPHCENGERVLYVFDLVLAMRRRWGWRFVDELCWTHVGHPGGWNNRFKNEFEPVYHFSVNGVKFCPHNVLHKSEAAFTYSPENNKDWGTGNTWIGADNVNRQNGLARPGNVIKAEYSEGGRVTGQSAIFLVVLVDFFIRAYSDTGDIWIDPFVGSGTTIVAAHQNNRRGLGIEKLEKYCAVTLQRLADMGLQPERVE